MNTTAGAEKKESTQTLRVKNLPPALSRDAVTTLLTHFGALRVRVLRRKKPGAVLHDAPEHIAQVAVAEFPSHEKLRDAQGRLARVHLAGRHLVVEAVVSAGEPEDESEPAQEDSKQATIVGSLQINEPLFAPPDRVPAPPTGSAPLAPHLGLHYAPSPLLRYKYPKATVPIVRNIANALIALPRFYTQVLHLMNKMNLPTPFEPNTIPGRFSEEFMPELTRGQSVTTTKNGSGEVEQIIEEEEEEESEIKGADDSQQPGTKRSRSETLEARQKRQRLWNESLASGTDIVPSRPGVISTRELDRQRLSKAEQARDPAFAGYEPGTPSCNVRVNNLAETVGVKELKYVFGHVIPQELALECMQIEQQFEGTSAMIVFPSLEVSQAAVERINGVVIDGKAAVVYFDRPAQTTNDRLRAAELQASTVGEEPHEKSAVPISWKRMDPSDLEKEKAMKNYNKGDLTQALYLKNLSKGVDEALLRSLCAPYLVGNLSVELLNVRYFSEGRMKNQAFIEFPSVDLAIAVLEGIHGLVVHGKPIVVSFRKSSS